MLFLGTKAPLRLAHVNKNETYYRSERNLFSNYLNLFLSIWIYFYLSESIFLYPNLFLYIWTYITIYLNLFSVAKQPTSDQHQNNKKPKSDQHKISSGTTSDLHQTQIRPSSAKHKFNIRPTKDQYQTTSDKNQSNLYLTNISKNLKILGIIL